MQDPAQAARETIPPSRDALPQTALDVGLAERRPEIGSVHDVQDVRHQARPAGMDIISGERRAQGAAGVTGGRLDRDISKRAVAENLAVGDAVEPNAAGEANTGLTMRGAVGPF